MIEHKFPYESFMGGWYMPEKLCDDIVNYFHTQSHRTNKGEVTTFGKSTVQPDWKEATELMIEVPDNTFPFRDYKIHLQEVMNNYQKKYIELAEMDKIELVDCYQIQYYKPSEGFKQWHCERACKKFQYRVLVFMTYLNDVDDGGTDFKYQNFTSPAKKGLTVIWPSDWTHTHKGQISHTKEKYIVTGWVGFKNE